MIPGLPQKMGKVSSIKPKRRALDATLSLVVDGEDMQDHIHTTNTFERDRRQRVYDQTGEVCIERVIRIQDRTLRQKKQNLANSDLNVTETKSKSNFFRSAQKRSSVETFTTSIQRQS